MVEHVGRESLQDDLECLPIDLFGLQVVQVEVRHLVGDDPPSHAEVEAPARELIEHADLFDEPERVVERQAVHARPQADAPGTLGGRGEEDAGHRRQPQRRRVVLGQVIRVEAGGVVLLQEAQPALVELVERRLPPVEMIEDPEVHYCIPSGSLAYGPGSSTLTVIAAQAMSVSAPGTRKPPVTGWTVTSPCGSSRRTRSTLTDDGSGTPTVTSTSIRPPRSRTSWNRGRLECRIASDTARQAAFVTSPPWTSTPIPNSSTCGLTLTLHLHSSASALPSLDAPLLGRGSGRRAASSIEPPTNRRTPGSRGCGCRTWSGRNGAGGAAPGLRSPGSPRSGARSARTDAYRCTAGSRRHTPDASRAGCRRCP